MIEEPPDLLFWLYYGCQWEPTLHPIKQSKNFVILIVPPLSLIISSHLLAHLLIDRSTYYICLIVILPSPSLLFNTVGFAHIDVHTFICDVFDTSLFGPHYLSSYISPFQAYLWYESYSTIGKTKNVLVEFMGFNDRNISSMKTLFFKINQNTVDSIIWDNWVFTSKIMINIMIYWLESAHWNFFS